MSPYCMLNYHAMKILVIEDQPKVSSFIKKGLEEESYIVDVVNNGQDGIDYAINAPYDLILLDILLPIKDGFQVCQEIRGNNISTPILMLTAKDVVEDKIKGLNAGADDYLTKPFSFAELLARIRALLRRGTSITSHLIQIQNIELDTVKHQAKCNEKLIELTTKEYTLLEYFMRNPNIVLTRTMIAENVWGLNFDTETNIIDVYINRLRNKISQESPNKFIHTLRGRGYVLKEKTESV